MKKVICSVVIAVAMLSTAEAGRQKVIYGEDNRVDPENAVNSLHVKISKSTSAQVANYKLTAHKSVYILKNETLQEAMNVCPEEKFSQQNAVARCSGFLVGPDLVVTAGHCVSSQSHCDNYSWVFDYKSDQVGDLEIEKSKVYKCKKILVQELNSSVKSDYALIQLDRAVTDREPLKFRTEGKVATGAGLVVIGHPSGLPTKISAGATVKENTHDQFFKSDLDTFGGNSGSAVFDTKSGSIEGILVRGAKDYVRTSRGCLKVNECEDMSSPGCYGESVSRITKVGIKKYLK
ncbi:MAG: trypsin-like peptidase domain-containing protein [Bacteriovoracaceae bacterium]|nr:trypsin-like peptidase domain-containing protein [Bacteriovoracaceae bacterium]